MLPSLPPAQPSMGSSCSPRCSQAGPRCLSHSTSTDELVRTMTLHPKVHFPSQHFLTAQAEPGPPPRHSALVLLTNWHSLRFWTGAGLLRSVGSGLSRGHCAWVTVSSCAGRSLIPLGLGIRLPSPGLDKSTG